MEDVLLWERSKGTLRSQRSNRKIAACGPLRRDLVDGKGVYPMVLRPTGASMIPWFRGLTGRVKIPMLFRQVDICMDNNVLSCRPCTVISDVRS